MYEHGTSCPTAEAWTYATRLGTNVIDKTPETIFIPQMYTKAAADHAKGEISFLATSGKSKLLTEKEKSKAAFVKTVCTLQYCSWNGFAQPPYHYNGVKPHKVHGTGPVFNKF